MGQLPDDPFSSTQRSRVQKTSLTVQATEHCHFQNLYCFTVPYAAFAIFLTI
jgi:hypothetical protein